MSSEQPEPRPDSIDAIAPAAQSSSDGGEVVETFRTTAIAHRSPRYLRFMLAGAILGALVSLILTFSFPENADYSRGQVFGFLLLGIGAIGVALGCVVALILDRSFAKKARTLSVERETTQPLS